MRYVICLCLLPLPSAAWEFTPDPICTLVHQAEDAEIAITFDAAQPEYALFITLRTKTWGEDPVFEMAFAGGQTGRIGTSHHTLSADRATLTVRDRGFGNVLDGIEFNTDLLAFSGTQSVTADTRDAGPAVQAFRACPQTDQPLS